MKIKPIIVAACIISVGTSAPEIFVSVLASAKGFPQLALGNIVGSNIANLALCLGLASLFAPVRPKRKDVKMDWWILIISSVALILFSANGIISLLEGLVLVGGLLLFFYLHTRDGKESCEETPTDTKPLGLIFVVLAVSFYGLYLGSEMLVKHAVLIAKSFGVSEKIISVTIVAFGTSAPEIATVVVAGLKKQNDISIGTLLGSNIVNILFAIGLSAVVAPMQLQQIGQFAMDYSLMLLIPLLLAAPIFSNKVVLNYKLGIFFIVLYFVYVHYSYA